jgi:hypothetical protein
MTDNAKPTGDDSLRRPDDIAPDPLGAIGDGSSDHANLRLACLREALAQAAALDMPRYADVLYRARINARFVLEGRTPGLHVGTAATGGADRE